MKAFAELRAMVEVWSTPPGQGRRVYKRFCSRCVGFDAEVPISGKIVPPNSPRLGPGRDTFGGEGRNRSNLVFALISDAQAAASLRIRDGHAHKRSASWGYPRSLVVTGTREATVQPPIRSREYYRTARTRHPAACVPERTPAAACGVRASRMRIARSTQLGMRASEAHITPGEGCGWAESHVRASGRALTARARRSYRTLMRPRQVDIGIRPAPA